MMPTSADIPVEDTAMMAKEMYDSLASIELMLEDFMDDGSTNPYMTDAIKQHMQAALNHVASVRKMHSMAMMPKLSDKKLEQSEIEEIAKNLSRQERWVIHHLGKRQEVNAGVLGSESSRIAQLGFIREKEGFVSLTAKGSLLNQVLVSSPAATH